MFMVTIVWGIVRLATWGRQNAGLHFREYFFGKSHSGFFFEIYTPNTGMHFTEASRLFLFSTSDFSSKPVKGFLMATIPTFTGAIMIWYMFVNVPTASKGFYKINGVSNRY